MGDVEANLRETLRRVLDPVAADPSRAAAILERARAGRVVRGIAAGLVTLLFAGGAALALEQRGDDRSAPAKEPPPFGTFAVSFPTGGSGTVAVDVAKGQVCIDLAGDATVYAAHLHYGPEGPDPVVAEFALSFETYRRPQCVAADRDHVVRLVADPETHYLDAHRDHSTPVAPLRPLDPAPELLPDVVEIVCTDRGAVALTPRVQPRRDGVHLAIYNQTESKMFNLTSPSGGDAGGRVARERVRNGWNIPPGPHALGCFRDDASIPFSDPDDPGYAHFTVVDPHGLWIDPALHCPESRPRAEIVTDERNRSFTRLPDMEALIREHVPGLRSDDEIVRATYPESAAKMEHRTLVRDGRKIATFYLSSEEDPAAESEYLWSLKPYVCPGSGVAPR